jgi:hypothetical protein
MMPYLIKAAQRIERKVKARQRRSRMKDIIDSGSVPTARLDEIFRQSKEPDYCGCP